MEPLPLADIVALIEAGRGTEQWTAGERPDVVFVTRLVQPGRCRGGGWNFARPS
jgi:hypothetical protein